MNEHHVFESTCYLPTVQCYLQRCTAPNFVTLSMTHIASIWWLSVHLALPPMYMSTLHPTQCPSTSICLSLSLAPLHSGHDESYNPPPEYLPTEEEVSRTQQITLLQITCGGVVYCAVIQHVHTCIWAPGARLCLLLSR